jgi:transcriptional regulator with XRE-family HTH domain
MSVTSLSLGQVIRERRRKLDLTQQDLARRIETSVPYVGLLETGRRHPSDKVVVKLAAALALDPRELFFLANPGNEAPNFPGAKQQRAFGLGWLR